MDLSARIVSAVAKARSTLGTLVLDYKVRTKTGSKYFQGKNTPIYDEQDVTGFVDTMEFKDVMIHAISNQIRATDVKVQLFIDNENQVPKDDSIVVDKDGNEFTVVKCDPIVAGSKTVMATVYLRK